MHSPERNWVLKKANLVQVPPPTFLVQLRRIFCRKCVMACIQMARVLFGGQPSTHRARVLISGQPPTYQVMVSATIISFLYTFILIPFNSIFYFFIEIKANRIDRKRKTIYFVKEFR